MFSLSYDLFSWSKPTRKQLATAQYAADYEAEMLRVDDSHITVFRGLGDAGDGFATEPRGSFLQRFSIGSHRMSSKGLSSPGQTVDKQSLLSVRSQESRQDPEDSDVEATVC